MAGVALAGPTAAVLAAAGPAGELLTPAERARADAFRSPGDRDDFVAAHALVRLCAGRLLGSPAHALTVVQRCGECGRPHGRPRLAEAPDLGVSLAHTKGWVAAAAAPGPVGIDVETDPGGPLDRRLAQRACTERELAAVCRQDRPQRAFLRQWVRKEALVKVGVATLDELSRLDLPVYGQEPPRWGAWRLTDWAAGAVVGCAAAQGELRLTLLD
ncbi:phosphopantetheinyl transferase-like protein [Streptomyces sp. Ru73]|uniref:4'-phosphopantetheinyl transferase family protein n=1 Tax=Streptomyces sp. Ru73 TaxID=2080748 RepID=UPI000CDDDC51|nr:4'-phosphopantetheinyl transferase superfamily protein [Streptomyces sp. Ru73]POX37949.1 phosphopantetheinyl transferase-like protein [Streptomyces sp. Ru73]